MDWGTLIAGFTGAFAANIISLGLLGYFVWPKIRKAMNPLGSMFQNKDQGVLNDA